MPISWPASTTLRISSGKVSIECPGMNHVVFRPYFSKSFSSRSDPTSPANMPREMPSAEPSPPTHPRPPPPPGQHAPRDVVGRVRAAVRAEPAGDRVHVDADRAEDLLRHALLP